MGISIQHRQLRLRTKLFILSASQLVKTHVVLQMLDWATTLFLILSIGTKVEVNPIMRYVLESPWGVGSFTAIKMAMCGLVAWVIPSSMKWLPNYMWIWRLLAMYYIGVVLNNLIGVVAVLLFT